MAGDAAVFFDFENIFYSVRNIYGLSPDFRTIMDECERHGRVIFARAYADWMQPELRQLPNALYANGVEPIYVPTYHRLDNGAPEGSTRHIVKNSVDLYLAIDVMKALFNLHTLGTFVLLTGDRDFIPLANVLKQHGKRVVVIGVQGSTSAHLAQAADEFVYYHDLLEDQGEPQETGLVTAATEPPSPASGNISPGALLPAAPSPTDLPVEPPRMGVEIASSTEQSGVLRYALRDLRSRRITHSVQRSDAHGLWLYAIDQHERGLPRDDEVQWIDSIGLWRLAWRTGRGRYDLVQRDAAGRLHVYYGVTEDGMTGPWAQFIAREKPSASGVSPSTRPDPSTDSGVPPLAPDEHLWKSLVRDD